MRVCISGSFAAMVWSLSCWLLLSQQLFQAVSCTYNCEDDVIFKLDWKLPPSMANADQIESSVDADLLSNEELSFMTKNRDQYRCEIHDHRRMGDRDVSDEKIIRDFANYLTQYIKNKPTITRHESYWTFGLSHGNHVRQYHEDMVNGEFVMQHVYHLGHFDMSQFSEGLESNDKLQMEVVDRYVSNIRYKGIAVNYSDGSICELNVSQARNCRVIYICDRDNVEQILQVTEIATCTYELIFTSPWVCKIRGLDRTDASVNIYCFGSNGTAIIPHTFKEAKEEAAKKMSGGLRQIPVRLTTTDGQTILVKVILGDGDENAEKMINEMRDDSVKSSADDHMNMVEEAMSSTANRLEQDEHAAVHENDRPLSNDELTAEEREAMRSFFAGKCLYVRSHGFWSYEICYNSHIGQYHEADEVSKYWSITLGRWDEDKHRKWYKTSTMKNRRPLTTRLLYGNGDVCHEISIRRVVEVELKCVRRNSNSSMVIDAYPIETGLCKYTFVIESPAFCHALSNLDNDGVPLSSLSLDAKPPSKTEKTEL